MGQKAFSIFIASFSAPIIPGVIASVGTTIGSDQTHWTELIVPKLGFFAVGYLITLIVVVLIGIPLFLFAERRGWARWWTALIAGCVIGFLLTLSLRAPALPPISSVWLGFINGISASMTFWLVFRMIQTYASKFKVSHRAG